MGDRELLEWAAKGHGFIDDAIDGSEAHGLHRDAEGLFYWVDANGWVPWAPADDDGQALRLAVKLNIHIEFAAPAACQVDRVQASPKGYGHLAEVVKYAGDPYAATRRAITKAAAEIGKSMLGSEP